MGHIYHPVKNQHTKMFLWWYVIIVISRFKLLIIIFKTKVFMLHLLASKLLLLLSLFLLSHLNIINHFYFYVKTSRTMAMGCHRIPFWHEQALRQLTDCLISLLIFPPEDHESLSDLVLHLSTFLICNVCPVWYEYHLPLATENISSAIIKKIL